MKLRNWARFSVCMNANRPRRGDVANARMAAAAATAAGGAAGACRSLGNTSNKAAKVLWAMVRTARLASSLRAIRVADFGSSSTSGVLTIDSLK
mmetsp:Transcript_15461/g.26632  ORF Transcript_15461/g.26632 Transcript_15461/m.26632 type:complete len:94 (-) Transcript_15461:521-802(-)